jgi:hypothetical protein
MPDLKTLDNVALLDLLAVHTAQYTAMLNNNQRGDKFTACETLIADLQLEINSRKESSQAISISDSSIQIPQADTE